MTSKQPIIERLSAPRTVFSVEFFPPKNEEGAAQMLATAEVLSELKPDFVSITYGAGGSTRERTLEYGDILHKRFSFTVMPHLTCVGHSKDELRGILDRFRDHGFSHVMALRGDPPKGEKTFVPHPDGLRYASDLVRLISTEYPEFVIGVGGYPEKHPEAPDMDADLRALKTKVDAGAGFVTTQMFFDNKDFFRYRDQCRALGINVPFIAGILPLSSLAQAEKFCSFCGAHLPEELRDALAAAGDNSERATEVGLEWAKHQVADLVATGVAGIHLYILNRSGPAIELSKAIRAGSVL